MAINGPERLLIAIQKPEKGNLGYEVQTILNTGGIHFPFPSRKDAVESNIEDVVFWRMRSGDLISSVTDRRQAHLGFAGLDRIQEDQTQFRSPILVEPLEDVSTCRVMLGLRNGLGFNSPKDLEGLTLVSSYENLLKKYLADNNVDARVIGRNGGAETLVDLGLADGVVEVSKTGTSLKENNMYPAATLLESQAYFIANRALRERPDLEGRVWRVLEGMLNGIYVSQYGLIKLQFPKSVMDDILKPDVLPARETPTIFSMANSDWVAAESLVLKSQYKKIKEAALNRGGKDIFLEKLEDMTPNRDDPRMNAMMRTIFGNDWVRPADDNFYPLYERVD